MKFSPYVMLLLEQKSGQDLRLPGDCEILALDIESVTGEHIGVNTLKRLMGFIADEREPRASTLDIIARYLAFDNWETLRLSDDKSNSAFGSSTDEIIVGSLHLGQCLGISYQPDRRLTLCFQGQNRFKVLSNENSKLQVDDLLIITHIVSGYPLLVGEVVRRGQSLGSFTAGKAQGITFKLL